MCHQVSQLFHNYPRPTIYFWRYVHGWVHDIPAKIGIADAVLIDCWCETWMRFACLFQYQIASWVQLWYGTSPSNLESECDTSLHSISHTASQWLGRWTTSTTQRHCESTEFIMKYSLLQHLCKKAKATHCIWFFLSVLNVLVKKIKLLMLLQCGFMHWCFALQRCCNWL